MDEKITVFMKAVRFYEEGCIEEAERICLQLCDENVKKADVYNLLAIINASKGEPEAADKNFKFALELAPERADIYSNYSKALYDYKVDDRALAVVTHSLDMNPHQPEAWHLSGMIELRRGNVSSAIESFRNAVTQKPKLFCSLVQLAQISLDYNGEKEAREYLIQAEKCVSESYRDYMQLGYLQKKLMRDGQAYLSFYRAHKLNPELNEALYQKATVDPIWKAPLEGKEHTLRSLEPQDAGFIYQCLHDEAFMSQYNRFMPRNRTVADLENEILKNSEKHPFRRKRMDWILVERKTSDPVGLAALADIQFNHRRAEFLIGLPDALRKSNGASVEASLLVIDLVFNKVMFNKLTSGVYGTNLRAQKNTLALGFTQEGFFEDHIYLTENEAFLSLYANGLKEKSFRENQRLSKLSKRLLGRDITRLEEESIC